MAANNQKNTRILLFLLLCIRMTLTVDANDFLFTSINTAQGLSDNQIRYILQLPDGRMVFTTNGNVNLYDGVHFSYLHRTAEDVSPLKQYEGCYRIYQCGDSLLWIKDYHKLMCIDLHQEKYIPHLDSYFRRKEIHEPVEDLFVDNSGRIWLLTSQELRELETGIRLALPENEHRKLQDIHSDELAVYLFYHTGEVVTIRKPGNSCMTELLIPLPNRRTSTVLLSLSKAKKDSTSYATAAKEDSSTLIPKTGHGRSCSNRTTRSTP